MKKLEKNEWQKKIRHNSWKTYALAALTALSLNFSACRAPTQVDIVNKEKKIEVVSEQLSVLKEQRKELVNRYNQYLALTGTPWYTSPEFKEAKAQLFVAIEKKDKEIINLLKEKWKLEEKRDKDIIKALEKSQDPNKPIDPNKFDFI